MICCAAHSIAEPAMRDSVSPSAPPLRPRDAIVPAVILLLLALVVLLQLTQPLFFFFNGAARQLPDGWWSHWTVLGDALVGMSLAVPWGGRRPDLVWSVCLAALVVTIMVHVLKPWMAAPRPPALLDPALFHVIGRALRSSSFPSGNTATAFVFAAVVSVHLRRGWLAALLLVLALPGFIGIRRRRPVLFVTLKTRTRRVCGS